MAIILPTSMLGFGSRAVTETTLDGADTLTYNESKNPVLILDNPSAGPATVNIDGDGGTNVEVNGVGPVDVSGGYSTASIAIGDSVAIPLKSINAYLKGTINITGGTGLIASLLEY